MKIETYILANNEEKIIPYVMRHYTQFSDVILLENSSTDRTIEIVESMGGEVWTYDREDNINDEWFTYIKNNCWKESKADWVIIVDADEFVYHPNIKEYLEKTDATIFLPKFFNMFSENFPTTEGQIYEEVNMGRQEGGKMNIFRPSEITDIDYSPGCHSAAPKGNVILKTDSELITMHMRHLSKQYVIDRNARFSKRLSQLNREKGWGWHVDLPAEDIIRYMDDSMKTLIKIL